jgi:hypothetical protein
MYFKSRAGLLPSFQPYQSLQQTLSQWVGTDVPVIVPWLLSFVNNMAILGFLFGCINGLLPGRNGITKGVIFGLIGWILMGLIFFPLIGLGAFAFRARLGCPLYSRKRTFGSVLKCPLRAISGHNFNRNIARDQTIKFSEAV